MDVQVCKLFNTIIKGSSEIQYRLALFFGQKLDGPPSGLDPAGRLELLREHEQRWTTLNWKKMESFPMIVGAGLWELAGGVFAQNLPGGGIRCRQMPSVLRGTESRTWDLENLGVNMRDFGMSPAEDLLVMVERQVRGIWRTEKLDLLSVILTGKEPHHPSNGFVFNCVH